MHFSKIRFLVLIPLLGLSCLQSAFAQQLAVDEPLAYNNKETWFDKIVSRQNTSLINGQEYFMPFKGFSTTPFFGSMELANEKVWYENQLYEDVPLLYDIYGDVLVLRIRDKNGLFAMVSVDKSKVEGFTLYHHRFRKYKDPRSAGNVPSYQYYDVLFEGRNLTLVAKRTKSRQVSGYVTEYEQEDKYYFIKGAQWIQLTSAKSFSALMESKKSEIDNFIKSKQIKVRKKEEKDLIAIAAFCNSLEGV
jgi:hypothetical protein